MKEINSRLIIPEYMCFNAPRYYKKGCKECEYKEVAKCNYNGWDYKKGTRGK